MVVLLQLVSSLTLAPLSLISTACSSPSPFINRLQREHLPELVEAMSCTRYVEDQDTISITWFPC